jgi:hypothetical protein
VHIYLTSHPSLCVLLVSHSQSLSTSLHRTLAYLLFACHASRIAHRITGGYDRQRCGGVVVRRRYHLTTLNYSLTHSTLGSQSITIALPSLRSQLHSNTHTLTHSPSPTLTHSLSPHTRPLRKCLCLRREEGRACDQAHGYCAPIERIERACNGYKEGVC